MKWINNMNREDKELMQYSPAVMVLLEINSMESLSMEDKKQLFKLSYLNGYTPHPLLRNYFSDMPPKFRDRLRKLDRIFPKDKKDRELLLKGRLKRILRLLNQMNRRYTFLFARNLLSFRRHAAGLLRKQGKNAGVRSAL